jgi:mono/diheme cytochrome c family protein
VHRFGFSVGAAVLLAALIPPRAARAQDASSLPDGPSKVMLLKYCSDCHMIDVVTGKRQNGADWKSTVARMAGYGIDMSVEEIEQLTDYLTEMQGLTPAKAVPPR